MSGAFLLPQGQRSANDLSGRHLLSTGRSLGWPWLPCALPGWEVLPACARRTQRPDSAVPRRLLLPGRLRCTNTMRERSRVSSWLGHSTACLYRSGELQGRRVLRIWRLQSVRTWFRMPRPNLATISAVPGERAWRGVPSRQLLPSGLQRRDTLSRGNVPVCSQGSIGRGVRCMSRRLVQQTDRPAQLHCLRSRSAQQRGEDCVYLHRRLPHLERVDAHLRLPIRLQGAQHHDGVADLDGEQRLRAHAEPSMWRGRTPK